MFSTPLTCCSIGCATSSDKVFGSAPGYCAVTTIVGGVISGNCATGKSVKAMQPKSTVTTEITIAKIGRSIKTCDNFMFPSLNYGLEFPFLPHPNQASSTSNQAEASPER